LWRGLVLDVIRPSHLTQTKERLVLPVKKLIAMLLMVAFLFTAAVGCGGDEKDKAKATKDKDKDKEKDKAK
jgi:hypothetical protein